MEDQEDRLDFELSPVLDEELVHRGRLEVLRHDDHLFVRLEVLGQPQSVRVLELRGLLGIMV